MTVTYLVSDQAVIDHLMNERNRVGAALVHRSAATHCQLVCLGH